MAKAACSAGATRLRAANRPRPPAPPTLAITQGAVRIRLGTRSPCLAAHLRPACVVVPETAAGVLSAARPAGHDRQLLSRLACLETGGQTRYVAAASSSLGGLSAVCQSGAEKSTSTRLGLAFSIERRGAHLRRVSARQSTLILRVEVSRLGPDGLRSPRNPRRPGERSAPPADSLAS